MLGFLFRLVGRVVGFAVKAALFVVATIAVGAGVMYALFDGNQFTASLTQRVQDLTGRVMTVDGGARLELTLPPRIVMNDVRIRNAQWGTRQDLARIRRVELRLNPLAAVAGSNSLAQVSLEGADIVLETNLLGEVNWAGIVAGTTAATQATLGVLGSSVGGLPAILLTDSIVTVLPGGGGGIGPIGPIGGGGGGVICF